MIKSIMDFIYENDPEVGLSIRDEFIRQQSTIELIASENIPSTSVIATMASCLNNKYAEGYPEHRYYGGCQYVDKLETLAIERVKKLFNCQFANVQPHSGANANLAAIMAFCRPADSGDKILSMSLSAGGHLTHSSPVNFSGKWFNVTTYGTDSNGFIDYNEVENTAMEIHPKLIIAGASAYPRAIDFKKFREIADKCGAYLMVDMAHIAGLVATGLHMSPLPYADIVTSTTHKTLRGPRGGLILWNNPEYTKRINSAVFPGTQGGPLEHIIAAKAVCFKEALDPSFKEYQQQIIKNAKAMENEFKKCMIDMVSGGTDNHLILLDLKYTGINGKELQDALDSVNITANKNTIPDDPLGPFITSGLRVGTPAITSRGMKEAEATKIADFIYAVIYQHNVPNTMNILRNLVNKMVTEFPIYE